MTDDGHSRNNERKTGPGNPPVEHRFKPVNRDCKAAPGAVKLEADRDGAEPEASRIDGKITSARKAGLMQDCLVWSGPALDLWHDPLDRLLIVAD